jgi:hypothetical protein
MSSSIPQYVKLQWQILYNAGHCAVHCSHVIFAQPTTVPVWAGRSYPTALSLARCPAKLRPLSLLANSYWTKRSPRVLLWRQAQAYNGRLNHLGFASKIKLNVVLLSACCTSHWKCNRCVQCCAFCLSHVAVRKSRLSKVSHFTFYYAALIVVLSIVPNLIKWCNLHGCSGVAGLWLQISMGDSWGRTAAAEAFFSSGGPNSFQLYLVLITENSNSI